MFFGFIYITLNRKTGKKYVGKKMFRKGWREYLGSSKWLQQDIDELGRDYFIRETIEVCHSKEDLNNREIYYQKLWNVKESDDWYNMHIQNENFDTTGLTYKYSDQRKKEIWCPKRRLAASERWKKNNPNNLPHVSIAQSEFMSSDKNPMNDPVAVEKLRKSKSKPFRVISPNGEELIFQSTVHFNMQDKKPCINLLKKSGRIKQGKNKGWVWVGYL